MAGELSPQTWGRNCVENRSARQDQKTNFVRQLAITVVPQLVPDFLFGDCRLGLVSAKVSSASSRGERAGAYRPAHLFRLFKAASADGRFTQNDMGISVPQSTDSHPLGHSDPLPTNTTLSYDGRV